LGVTWTAPAVGTPMTVTSWLMVSTRVGIFRLSARSGDNNVNVSTLSPGLRSFTVARSISNHFSRGASDARLPR
jgi:hypothetical protein